MKEAERRTELIRKAVESVISHYKVDRFYSGEIEKLIDEVSDSIVKTVGVDTEVDVNNVANHAYIGANLILDPLEHAGSLKLNSHHLSRYIASAVISEFILKM
ncbi:MAG: hypothetical protein WC795_00420 [Candidatus Paceibacterota bacterium]|jgi:SepF-like predicted cell division protein (DUF552 family)